MYFPYLEQLIQQRQQHRVVVRQHEEVDAQQVRRRLQVAERVAGLCGLGTALKMEYNRIKIVLHL